MSNLDIVWKLPVTIATMKKLVLTFSALTYNHSLIKKNDRNVNAFKQYAGFYDSYNEI